MANRRRTRIPPPVIQSPTIQEALDGTSFIEEPTQEEIENEEKRGEFLAQFAGKDYKIIIERYNVENGELEICDRVKLDGFDPFLSVKRYGSGRYRLSLRDNGGKYVKGGNQEVHIAKPLEGDIQKPEENALTNPIVQLMLENAKSDKMQMMELMKTVMSAMTQRPPDPPRGPTLNELVESLSKLKGLTPQSEDKLKGVREILGLMSDVKNLIPEAEKASSGGVLSELGDAVKIAKELGIMRTPHMPQPGTVMIPRPQDTAVNPPAFEAPKEDEMTPNKDSNSIAESIQKYIPIFEGWAKRNYDPGEASIFLVDELDNEIVPAIQSYYGKTFGMPPSVDTIYSNLIEKSKEPVEIEKIFQFAPALAPYREWCGRVIVEAVAVLTNPVTESESTKLVEAVEASQQG